MIVIDVGCARYGGDFSIERLVNEFWPDILYGFDPNPATPEVTYMEEGRSGRGDPLVTRVTLKRSAAWTHDGEIGYLEDGLNSCLTYREDAPKVPCFDLARFINELPGEGHVLKMDAEGSEYDVLSHLMVKGADELLSVAIIEWHLYAGIERPTERRQVIEQDIRCEIREWPW